MKNQTTTAVPLQELYKLWDKLRDVPTVPDGDNAETIEEAFLDFKVGTHREEIWRWFESQNDAFIVGEVMEGVRRTDASTLRSPEARYKNPWHQPRDSRYGPEFYTTTVKPAEHAGHLIYERIEGSVWDVVKDGACVAQRAGINGAQKAAEEASRPVISPAKSGPSM
jgi:hypothetical protein